LACNGSYAPSSPTHQTCFDSWPKRLTQALGSAFFCMGQIQLDLPPQTRNQARAMRQGRKPVALYQPPRHIRPLYYIKRDHAAFRLTNSRHRLKSYPAAKSITVSKKAMRVRNPPDRSQSQATPIGATQIFAASPRTTVPYSVEGSSHLGLPRSIPIIHHHSYASRPCKRNAESPSPVCAHGDSSILRLLPRSDCADIVRRPGSRVAYVF